MCPTRRFGVLCPCIVVVTVLAFISCTGPSVRYADLILFEKWLRNSGRDGWGAERVEIWMVHSDGSGLRRLTTGFRDTEPAWSPDRGAFVFAREDSGLWLFEMDSGIPKRLVASDRVKDPQWLSSNDVLYAIPTGREERYPDRWRLYIYSLKDQSSHLLAVPGLGSFHGTKVSPDRKWLAFRASDGQRRSIFLTRVSDVAGSAKVILTEDEVPLKWLPDSSGFLIRQDMMYTVVRLDGITEPLLPSVEAQFFSWSLTGDSLAIADSRQLWIQSREGRERRGLAEADEEGLIINPVWLN